MRLTVDGRVRELHGDPLTPLLDALREAGVTAPKAGCRQGGCGACTVLVDGEPRRSCLLPLAHAEGARVVTAAGLGDPQRLSPLQRAFHEHYGAQCGFCSRRHVVRGDRARRAPRRRAHARRGGRGARRPLLPLHGLREDHRLRAGGGAREAAA